MEAKEAQNEQQKDQTAGEKKWRSVGQLAIKIRYKFCYKSLLQIAIFESF
ncbi:hypothetical protein ACIF2S_14480 [Pseudomonas taetrolens]